MPEIEVIETQVETEPTTTETTPPVETAETPTPESTPQPTEPTPEDRQTKFQRRIDKLTREKHDLQRALDAVSVQRAPVVEAPPVDVEPQEADFADYGSYIKAFTTYAVQKAQREEAQIAQIQERQAADARIANAFEPQLEAARMKYEDFDDVVSAPIFAQDTQAMLMQSPHGAEIGYYLGLRPTEAAAINAMTPVAKARAIIALEQKIGSQQTKTVSTAPAPITPVTGAAGSVKDPDKMTTDEWMAWNRQQHLERLKTKPLV